VAGANVGEDGIEIGSVRGDAGEGAHAGVDVLFGKQIGAIRREHHAVEGEPVGDAEEGADVAGVLHAVEGEGEAAVERAGGERQSRDLPTARTDDGVGKWLARASSSG